MSVGRRLSAVASPSAAGAVIALLSVGLLGPSCGGGSSPQPNPTVAPTPTPSPTPLGAGTFSDVNCALGKGSPFPDYDCEVAKTAALQPRIESAMDQLVQQKPQLFNLGDESTPGSGEYKVVDREGYMQGIVFNLRAMGMCSERDFDDATQSIVRAKSTNDFSEEFTVIDSSGHMQRGSGMYHQTCTPADFPFDRGADAPPLASGCYRPYPPQVSRFNCKIHFRSKDYYTLDSTPIVGPDPTYCYSIGYTDGRSICTIREEGVSDRSACEDWRVGTAKDTGRPGPTWTKEDGTYCTGQASGCQNSPDNQYQLWTYVGGTYNVVGQTGSACSVSY